MKHDVAVADHRALGRPRRAGGVDKHCEILGLRKPEFAFPHLGIGSFVLSAALKQLVEGDDLIVAVAARLKVKVPPQLMPGYKAPTGPAGIK